MLEEFKKIGELLFEQGLVNSHGGDLSLRQGNKIFITRDKAMLGQLKEEDLIEVSLEANGDNPKASKELVTHRAIYANSQAQAVIHAHPVSAIAVSITDNKIVPQDCEGINSFKSAPIVRVRNLSDADENARMLPNFLNNNNKIAVLRAHGSFAIGANLEEALQKTSALEHSCKILVAIRSSAQKKEKSDNRRQDNRRQDNRRQDGRRQSAIPPGIGVMDRTRYTRNRR